MSNTNIPRAVAYAIRNRVHPVKAYRLYAGISAEQLAAETGISVKRIHAIEDNGIAEAFEYARLSKELGAPARELRTRMKKSPAAG